MKNQIRMCQRQVLSPSSGLGGPARNITVPGCPVPHLDTARNRTCHTRVPANQIRLKQARITLF
jgi:hypothetical protein